MMKKLLLALALVLVPSAAFAAFGTIYVQTTNSAATYSGSTDADTPTFSGAAVDASNVAGTTIVLPTNTNLTGLAADGSQSIFWNNSTVTAQKIFWITGVTGCTGTGACSVSLASATTCTTCGAGSWAIGGRYLWPSAGTSNIIDGAITAGYTVQFNDTPATKSAVYFTVRNSGDSTNGFITYRGKAGVYPTLEVTNTSNVINLNSKSGVMIRGLILKQDGASGDVASGVSGGDVIYDTKVTGGGGNGIAATGGVTVENVEISGCGAAGISALAYVNVFSSYIHDNTGAGITIGATQPYGTISNSVIDSNGAQGIYFTGSVTAASYSVTLQNSTIYGNALSGLQVDDPDVTINILNDIFQDNASTSGANVNWTAGNAELHGRHEYNDFYQSGAATNLINLTANSTEVTTSPAFTNAAGGNFTIASTGAAYQTGSPGTLGSATTGYASMGAAAPNATGGGSAHFIGSGM